MLSPGRDEDGFTLVELLVAMTIMLVVTGALFGALVSGTRSERTASTRIDDEQSVRLVLAQFARDARSASAVLAATSLPSEVDLEVGGTHVRWAYVGGTLSRSAVDDSTGASTPGVRAAGLLSASFATTSPAGTALASAPGVTSTDIARCSTTVTVQVVAGGHAPLGSFSQSAAAAIPAAADLRGCP